MRLPSSLGVAGAVCFHLLAVRPALGADDPALLRPAPPAAAPGEDAAPADPFAAQRDVLFDIALRALVAGDLLQAEHAFTVAAGLGGDPAARSVAASFAARVRALRIARLASPPPGSMNPGPRSAASSTGPGAVPAPDNAGHVPFLLTTTALGLGLYGWTLPGALGVHANEAPRTFLGLYMLGAAGSFALPFFATHGDNVSAGQANLAFYGGTRGAYLGQLLAALISGDVSSSNRYGTFAGSLLAGSVLGLTTGMVIADRSRMSPGQAHTTGVIGDFGLGMGFGFAFLFGFDDSEQTRDSQARRIGGTALLGTSAGLVGGYWLGLHRDNTWGDAEVMRASGLCGVLAGITVADGLNTGKQASAATLMVAGALGAVVGDRLVVNTDFTVGQSIVVDLSTVAGGLASAGLLYLVSPVGWSERPFLLAGTLGAGGGLAVSYLAFSSHTAGAAANGAARDPENLRFSLLPMLGFAGVRGITLSGGF